MASASRPGVACAPAFLVRLDFPEVPDRAVRAEEVELEVRRLREAVDFVVAHLQELGERVLQRAGPEESRIFDAQILMAQDRDFLAPVEALIRKNQLSAETAYEFKALELRNVWSGAARLRERLADLHAIQLRMLDRLMGGPGRALVDPGRRAGDRRGPRAVARAHRAARPRARRRPDQRGGHPHGTRGDPGPLARHPRRDGRVRRDDVDPPG